MSSGSSELFGRDVVTRAGELRAAGVAVRLTAWSLVEDTPLLLEVADYAAVLERLQQHIEAEGAVRFVGPDGDETPLNFALVPNPSWTATRQDSDSKLAVATWLAAPVGRMMRERQFEVATAEKAGSLLQAAQPLVMVLNAANRASLMVAGPQRMAAGDDEAALARAFAGILKDCYHLPIPSSDGLALALWRELRQSEQTAADAVPQVADMAGHAIVDGAAIAAEPPVWTGYGLGLRAWLVTRETVGAVEAAMGRYSVEGRLRELLAT